MTASSVSIRDVDGDGYNDLLLGNTNTMLPGRANGIGARIQIPTLPSLIDTFGVGDLNGDDPPELFVLDSASDQLRRHINRRGENEPSGTAVLDSAHLLQAPSIDRFGAPWTLPIILRRVANLDARLRQSTDARGTFRDGVRHSGQATLPATYVAATDTWRAAGDFASYSNQSDGAYSLFGLQQSYGAVEMVLDLPTVGTVDATKLHVFAGLDTTYETTANGRLTSTPFGVLAPRPARSWMEVPRDSDGDLATGSGPRFVLSNDGATVRIATPTLGVFRAYVAP